MIQRINSLQGTPQNSIITNEGLQRATGSGLSQQRVRTMTATAMALASTPGVPVIKANSDALEALTRTFVGMA